ncbi:MAG: carbamoyltransferase [Rickettsiales bacterium]|nr:carbamoyltransferase [Rickettsiales bacterium]
MDILGISFGIDSSACLLRNGKVVAAVLEERFSRVKHDVAWPQHAISWCLSQANTDLRSIDQVAFFWNPALQLDFPHPGRSRSYRHHGDYLHMVPSWLLAPAAGGAGVSSPSLSQRIALDQRHRPLEIHYIDHHLCHAASAFFPSPYQQAAVLTADGYGERAATSLATCSSDGLQVLEQFEFPNSLGSFYAAITSWLGFRANSGEGKVMGLAPYGDNSLVGEFREILGLGGQLPYDLNRELFSFYLDRPSRVSKRFIDRFGPAAEPGSRQHSQHHKAVAFAAQNALEEAMLALTARLHELSGQEHLVMAGGVAMNSVANGRIERESPFSSLWIQPSSGDGGTAVGAALWVWHEMLKQEQRHPWSTDRLGPSFSPEQCRSALRKGGWSWHEPEDLCDQVAAELEQGALVGWFQGAAELGARALGGRSILADPRPAANKDLLNQRVKFREGFRPFAPSVIEERVADFFELDSSTTIPWMQKVYPVREQARDLLGAVTHVDGTARLQTVNAASAPKYHALISAFGKRTGVPVLLNTSFNVRGEPMVLSPDDAIRCWATTGLDLLVLGPCILRKAPA